MIKTLTLAALLGANASLHATIEPTFKSLSYAHVFFSLRKRDIGFKRQS